MVNNLTVALHFYSRKSLTYKTHTAMISSDKAIEVLCILDELCKNLDAEWTKILHVAPVGEGYKRMRNRKCQMSKSEVMTLPPFVFS